MGPAPAHRHASRTAALPERINGQSRPAALEIAQSVGQSVARQLDGRLKLQLAHHPALVKLHRLGRDMQHPSDFLGRISCRH